MRLSLKPTLWKALAPLVAGALIAVLPVPEGLRPHAWYFLALFIAVLVALILEPIPAAAVGFMGVFLAAILGLTAPPPGESLRWALSGFSNATVWLIFGAFMLALGYQKTGLGRRLALLLVRSLGKRTLGLGYAVTLADLILAPVTPSNTARSGGTIFPIILNIPPLYQSFPGPSSRKIGAYLMWTAYAATCITSSMFMTATAPSLLAVELINKTSGISITWMEWAAGFLPVGIVLILATPYLIYKIYPPEIKNSGEVTAWASQELAGMGKVTTQELLMAVLATLALILWIFGASFIDATTVAGAVISLMLLSRIITWNDMLQNLAAWNVLVWFATLVTMADGLSRVGFVTWVTRNAADLLLRLQPLLVMVLLVTIFFIVHYMFASLTAHTTAILPVMMAAGAAVPGIPPKVFALLLCYALGLMGILTPYGAGPAPVYFASGYIRRKDFWGLGLIFGMIFLGTLLLIGVPYLLWEKS